MLPGMAPVVVGGGLASLHFVGAAVDPADLTTYNLTLPSAVGPGKVLVAVASRSAENLNRTIDSATVGGQPASVVAHASSGTGTAVQIIAVDLAAATTSVSVTFSGITSRCGVAAFNASNLSSLTPTATTTNETATTAPSVSIDVQAGGVVVAVEAGTGGGTASWTNVTKANDIVIEGTIRFSSAYGALTMAAVGLAVRCSIPGQGNTAMAVAAFR